MTVAQPVVMLDALAAAYYAEGCGKNAICPPCPLNGLSPYCIEGRCSLAGSAGRAAF